jgi:ATP-binding cassette subfamily F protein 3
MLTVNRISKSFGVETILKEISFTLNLGQRLALVGPNGSGKTTLLRIILGQDTADSGSVLLSPPQLRLGYLPQGFEFREGETIASFIQPMEGNLPELSAELEALAVRLAKTPGDAVLLARYESILDQLSFSSENSGSGESILAALGLGDLPADMPAANLSGGQKTRLALAGVLISNPQLLILDEPTNHLDLDMLEWLEAYLLGDQGALAPGIPEPGSTARRAILIVSHDRAFLDQVATGILELDISTHMLRTYSGNYSDYLEQKLAERSRQWEQYSDWQAEIARLKRASARVRGDAQFKRGGKGDSGDKFAKGFFANRTLETMRRAKSLERRIDHLLTDERVDKPQQDWQMKLEFTGTPESSRDVLVLDNLAVGYLLEEPLVLLRGVNLYVRHGARVAMVGPNGSGKTTLMRTIAGLLPPLEGRIRLGPSVRIGYMAQEQEDLDLTLDAFTTIRRYAPLSETETRAFLHKFLFSGDDVFVPVGRLSYGERARLSLACLVAMGSNLLLLDEPINHLDIPSRSRFEQALAAFDGTVLAVVHDRYFIDGFASQIWNITGSGIELIHRQL